jgi:hypothetical protein
MRLFTLFCIVLLTLTINIYSQNNEYTSPEINIDIFSRLLDNGLNDLENQLIIAGQDKLYVLKFPDESEEKDFIQLKLKQRFGSYKLLTGNSFDEADYGIVFENPKLRTNYKEVFTSSFLGNKRVKRKIDVVFLYKILDNKTEEEIYSNTINESFEDDFLLDNLEQIERSNYTFTKENLPDENLFEKFLVPAVIVAASAVAIILFFVIRSK